MTQHDADASVPALRTDRLGRRRLFAGRPLLAQLSRGDQRTLRELLRRAVGSPAGHTS
jgi:hypothetical protein